MPALIKTFTLPASAVSRRLSRGRHISPGVSRRFLWNEWRKAYAQQLTHDCRRASCTGCGVCQALGVKIVDYKEEYQNNGEVQA